jgi:hypothetical protein
MKMLRFFLMAKVYVSSTFLDLQDCREQVMRVLRAMGHEDMAMEYYVAEDQRPVDKCLSDVAACDLYVGIFAWRYGWVPKENNPDQLSITELEYRQAVKTSKPCLIFFLEGRAPWPPDFIDDDKTQIKKFRNELNEKHVIAYFKSAENIDSVVATAIHNWEKQHNQISPSALIPQFDLSAYFNALKKRYQRLDLDALTPPQKEEYLQLQLRSVFVEQNARENPPPVELPKEVWERLQCEEDFLPEMLSESVSIDDAIRAREAYYEKPSRSVLDVLIDTHNQYVVILGDPGSGKSTLSRYVLLSLIDPKGNERLRRAFDGYLPLLIEMRHYASLCADNKCETFLEFLEYLGKTEGWHLTQTALHNHLKNDGCAVVIFDGLDEIFDPEDRERITRRIVGIASVYPKVRIIVTSRVIGYRRKILTDADFAHFTLQDLAEQQVATFVDRWYGLALSDRPDEAKECRERIMRSFKESASIRQLAGNPMLLTIMTIIGKHQELPRERWKLYDHAASVLIQHWDVNKHLKDQRMDGDFIDEDDKRELLRRLAYKMQGGDGGLAGNYIHREHLQAEFEAYLKERYGQTPDRAAKVARAMLDQFRERNFILSLYGANFYGFVHRAFLEYFCASAFVYKFEKRREMTLDQMKHEVYGTHWEDQSWHEVLRMICGMIDEKIVGEIIDYLANEAFRSWPKKFGDHPPWNIALAVQCLSEVRNLGKLAEPAKRLLQAICALFDRNAGGGWQLSDFLKKQILPPAKIIGPSWPHRAMIADWLKDYRSPEGNYSIPNAELLGEFVGSIGTGLHEVHRVILNYASHKNASYRYLAPPTLAKGWRDDLQTLPLLQERAVNDNHLWVRYVAVSALVEHFRDDPQILPLLCDRVINDENFDVRRFALSALVEHFRNGYQIFPLLYNWAINAEKIDIRRAAIAALAEYFQDNPQTLALLRDCLAKDSNEGIRTAAVAALIRHFRGDFGYAALSSK